ncbi:TVG0737684 [Thermoplasma volcanium GSS1]|uniref:TVG0737684 protein n=1 Tax=Thermoplasma volcanium (strain ATCC 51530 / DSM 4299 / JCM 9571 / NBRC 15438 / GSS1) TaxID=273116 RepID=Q97AS8_THEVO|nr:YwgA family protein [Thermoplasma volcanium]BAB59873.1 TVG0737684 [Thermoplasma volcanium GSS1]
MINVKIETDWDKLLSDYENSKELNVEDIILLLLNYGKISGKTMMQKQVFLTVKEVFTNISALYHPDKYGPYSQLVSDIVVKLINDGKIIKFNRGEGHATYAITESGKEYINKVIKSKNINNEDLEKLRKNKYDWDEWDTKGILRYVYRNYPEYATKTKVPELKWE